jgi:hypothetical protein
VEGLLLLGHRAQEPLHPGGQDEKHWASRREEKKKSQKAEGNASQRPVVVKFQESVI